MNAACDGVDAAVAEGLKRAEHMKVQVLLVLSPSAPLDSAKEMLRRCYAIETSRTLHHQQATFYKWAGTHYREAEREEVRSEAYNFLDGAQRVINDQAVPFNPTRAKVSDVVEALAAAAQLPFGVRPPTWLSDEPRFPAIEMLPCANGLLHVPTRTLIPHTPDFFGIYAVPYPYDAAATPPATWLAFLNSIWPDDRESIVALQELFGLLLTPETKHQKAFLIVGPKRSGKGTIARVLTALLGPENVAGPTLNSLSQNFGLAPLIGRSLAIISDARLSGRADAHVIAERILSITGEDSLSIDRKFLPAWTGRLSTRFLIMTNELPKLSDASGALASRFIILRLMRSFYGREDMTLASRLLDERSSILCWAMVGLDRLTKRGHFRQPESALQAVRDLEDLASPIGAFVRDRCLLDEHYSIECNKLFEAWVTWCGDNGRDRPGTTQIFGRDLTAAFPQVETKQVRIPETDKRLRFYCGVALQ
jgi:putative DNA primase/helicase